MNHVPENIALVGFLRYLEKDLEARPQAIRPLDEARRARAQALIGDIEVDLDAKLSAEVE